MGRPRYGKLVSLRWNKMFHAYEINSFTTMKQVVS